jgi:hypothetical protein
LAKRCRSCARGSQVSASGSTEPTTRSATRPCIRFPNHRRRSSWPPRVRGPSRRPASTRISSRLAPDRVPSLLIFPAPHAMSGARGNGRLRAHKPSFGPRGVASSLQSWKGRPGLTGGLRRARSRRAATGSLEEFAGRQLRSTRVGIRLSFPGQVTVASSVPSTSVNPPMMSRNSSVKDCWVADSELRRAVARAPAPAPAEDGHQQGRSIAPSLRDLGSLAPTRTRASPTRLRPLGRRHRATDASRRHLRRGNMSVRTAHTARHRTRGTQHPDSAHILWRLASLGDPGLPEFITSRALPKPTSSRCELGATRGHVNCSRRS